MVVRKVRFHKANKASALAGAFAFANSAAAGFSGCAKLTADIHYLGNADLLNSSRDGVTAVPQKQWTPLQNFAGTFDGQDHTI